MKTVLCIGGLDPAGRAGLLLDAKAVCAQGLRPLCAAASLTFQSSKRMLGFHPVPTEILAKQLQVLIEDEAPSAVKIGQLASAANVALLVDLLQQYELGSKTVVDTPVRSSLGGSLFGQESLAEVYAPLLALSALVTPNAPEALLLSQRFGETKGEHSFVDLQTSLNAAASLPAKAVLLTGGHVREERDGGGEGVPGREDELCDRLLVDGQVVEQWSSPRLPSQFRGTGCRLASAIAAQIALGNALQDAVSKARSWLLEDLKSELYNSG